MINLFSWLAKNKSFKRFQATIALITMLVQMFAIVPFQAAFAAKYTLNLDYDGEGFYHHAITASKDLGSSKIVLTVDISSTAVDISSPAEGISLLSGANSFSQLDVKQCPISSLSRGACISNATTVSSIKSRTGNKYTWTVNNYAFKAGEALSATLSFKPNSSLNNGDELFAIGSWKHFETGYTTPQEGVLYKIVNKPAPVCQGKLVVEMLDIDSSSSRIMGEVSVNGSFGDDDGFHEWDNVQCNDTLDTNAVPPLGSDYELVQIKEFRNGTLIESNGDGTTAVTANGQNVKVEYLYRKNAALVCQGTLSIQILDGATNSHLGGTVSLNGDSRYIYRIATWDQQACNTNHTAQAPTTATLNGQTYNIRGNTTQSYSAPNSNNFDHTFTFYYDRAAVCQDATITITTSSSPAASSNQQTSVSVATNGFEPNQSSIPINGGRKTYTIPGSTISTWPNRTQDVTALVDYQVGNYKVDLNGGIQNQGSSAIKSISSVTCAGNYSFNFPYVQDTPPPPNSGQLDVYIFVDSDRDGKLSNTEITRYSGDTQVYFQSSPSGFSNPLSVSGGHYLNANAPLPANWTVSQLAGLQPGETAIISQATGSSVKPSASLSTIQQADYIILGVTPTAQPTQGTIQVNVVEEINGSRVPYVDSLRPATSLTIRGFTTSENFNLSSPTATGPAVVNASPGSYTFYNKNFNPPTGYRVCSSEFNSSTSTGLSAGETINFTACIEKLPDPVYNLEIKKFVSHDGINWHDANTSGLSLDMNRPVYYRLLITNDGSNSTINLQSLSDVFQNTDALATVPVVPSTNLSGYRLQSEGTVPSLNGTTFNPGIHQQGANNGGILIDYQGFTTNSCQPILNNSHVINTATITGTDANGRTLEASDNAQIQVQAGAHCAPSVQLKKYVRLTGTTTWSSSVTAQPGQTVEYKVIAYNSGTVPSSAITGQDVMNDPSGIIVGEVTQNLNVPILQANNGSCASAPVSPTDNILNSFLANDCASPVHIYSYTTSATNPGSQTSYTATNTATVGSSSSLASVIVNYSPGTTTKSKTCTVNGRNCDGAQVTSGDVITYTITETHSSGSSPVNVTIVDNVADVAPYADISAISNPACSYNSASQTINCGSQTINPGQSFSFSFNATVKAQNQLPASGPYTIRNTYGNTTTTEVVQLGINKTSLNSPIYVNQANNSCSDATADNVAQWQITVNNPTSQAVSGVQVIDTLDPSMTYISGTTSGISEPTATNPLTWNISTISAGSQVTFTFKTCYTASQVNIQIPNTVRVLKDGQDYGQSTANVYVQGRNLTLQGYVWQDNNNNGLIDNAETGISGVIVTLLDNSGTQIANASTANNGAYSFSARVSEGGRYQIRVQAGQTVLQDYSFTALNRGGAVNIGQAGTSCATNPPCNNATQSFDYTQNGITSAQAAQTHNFGFDRATGNLQIRVFEVNTSDNTITPFDHTPYSVTSRIDNNNQTVWNPAESDYSDNNNRTFNDVPTGTAYADVTAPSGWRPFTGTISGKLCGNTVAVTQGNTATINLCLQGTEAVEVAKYVRQSQAGSGNWVNVEDLGTITVGNDPSLDYLIIAWNHGAGTTTVDIRDTTLSAKDQLYFNPAPSEATRNREGQNLRAENYDPTSALATFSCNDSSARNYIAYCYTVTLDDRYDQAVQDTIVNFARAFDAGTDTLLDEDDARVSVRYTGQATENKVVDLNQARPGQTITYTLTVENEGSAPLVNYAVSDNPTLVDTDFWSFVDFVSGTLTYTDVNGNDHTLPASKQGSSVVFGNITSLGSTQVATATFSVRVKAAHQWPSGEARLSNLFGDNVTTDLLAVTIDKKLADGQSPNISPPGDDSGTDENSPVRYEVEIINRSSQSINLSGVEVQDRLPSGFWARAGAEVDPASINATVNNRDLVFQLPNQNLAAGATFRFEYTAYNQNFQSGSYCNEAQAYLSGDLMNPTPETACVTVVPSNIIIEGYVWNDDGDGLIDLGEQGVRRAHNIRLRLSCDNGLNLTTSLRNDNGYYQFASPQLVEGLDCTLSIDPASIGDNFAHTGTSEGGRIPFSGADTQTVLTDNDTISLAPLTALDSSPHARWNFGLERLTGDLRVELWNADNGQEITDSAQIGDIFGSFQIINKPFDNLTDYAPTDIPPETQYADIYTGRYEVDFTPPAGFADVTTREEANPYYTTVNSAAGDEVIRLWISGSQNVRVVKYVWNETDDVWTSEIDVQPGDQVYYLALAYNTGSSPATITVEDTLARLNAFSSRSTNPYILLDGQVIPAGFGADQPSLTSFVPTDDRQVADGSYYKAVTYSETLVNDYAAGDYRIPNTAILTDGASGSARAYINVSYDVSLDTQKTVVPAPGNHGDGSATNPFIPGDTIIYTIEVENTGSAPITTTIEDNLNNGTNNVADYADIVGAVSEGGQIIGSRIVWEDITINPGQTKDLTFSVIVRNSDNWTDAAYLLRNSLQIANQVVTAPDVHVFDLSIDKRVDRNTRTISPPELSNNEVIWNIIVTNKSQIDTDQIGPVTIAEELVGLPGFRIIDSSANVIDNGDDTFTIDNIPAGQSFTMTVTMENTTQLSGVHRNTAAVELGGREFDRDDATVRVEAPEVTLGGYVWIDEGSGVPINDNDALINIGEPGLRNVTVQLFDLTDPSNIYPLTATTTNGRYSFDNVILGHDYQIIMSTPNRYNVGDNNLDGVVGANPEITGIATPDTSPTIWEVDSLSFADSQNEYNFSLSRQTSALRIRVWDVSNGFNPFEPQSLLTVTTTSPQGYIDITSTNNDYPLTVPLGTYTSTLADNLFSTGDYVNVTNSTAGCNESTTVTLGAPAEINLCVMGDAQVNINKVVRQHVGGDWTDTTGNYQAGQTVEYAVRLWNQGSRDVQIDVEDILTSNPNNILGGPQNIQINGVNSTLPANLTLAGDVDCVAPDYDTTIFEPCSVVIVYQRSLADQGLEGTHMVTNRASFDGSGVSGQASADIEVSYGPDLRYQKTVQCISGCTPGLMPNVANPAKPGDVLQYSLRVRNIGTSDYVDYRFRDDLTDILQYVERASVTSGQAGWNLSGNEIIWPLTDIPTGGAWVTRTFRVTIADSTTWPTSGDFELNNTFNGQDVAVPVKDIRVEKRRLSDYFVAPSTADGTFNGGITRWQIEVFNISNQPITAANNLLITDVLPGNTEYLPGSTQPVDRLHYTGTPTNSTWELAPTTSIAPGQSLTFSFETINGNAQPSTVLENCAQARQDGVDYVDPIWGCAVTVVEEAPSAQITKEVSVTPPTAVEIDRDNGTVIEYTVRVQNTGNVPFDELVIEDRLPVDSSGHRFTYHAGGSISVPTQGLVMAADPATYDQVVNGRPHQVLQWAMANYNAGSFELQPNEEMIITYEVLIPADIDVRSTLPGYVNTVTIRDGLTNLGSDTAEVLVDDLYVDLWISKTDNQTQIRPGETTTYTIEIENRGNTTATNVLLQDNLPTNASYQAGTASMLDIVLADGSLVQIPADDSNAVAGLIQWGAFDLPAGARGIATISVVADADLLENQEVFNQACTHYDNDLSTEICNGDRDTVIDSQVEIDKWVSHWRVGPYTSRLENVAPGQTVWYRVRVQNIGSAPETFHVKDILPVDNKFTQVIDPVGNIYTAGDPLEFSLTDPTLTLEPGQVQNYFFSADLQTAFPTTGSQTIVNTAGVDFEDDGVFEAEDTATIVVETAPFLEYEKIAENISKGVDATTIAAQEGDLIRYTLSVTNTGSSPTADNFIFEDNLDGILDDLADPVIEGVNIFLASGANNCPSLPTLNAGQLRCDTLDTIDPGQTVSYSFDIIVGGAETTGDNTLVNTWQGQRVEISTIAPSLEVRKFADRSTVREGNRVIFTIEVENVGNQIAEDVVIVDELPQAEDAAGNVTTLPAFIFNQMTGTGMTRDPFGNGAAWSDSTILTWNTNDAGSQIDIAPGQTIRLSFSTRAALLPADNEITYINAIQAFYNGTSSNRAEVPVTVLPIPAPELSIQKTLDGQIRESGEVVEWTITVTNLNHLKAQTGVYIQDFLPYDSTQGLYFTPMYQNGLPIPADVTIRGFDPSQPVQTLRVRPEVTRAPITNQYELEWPNDPNGFTIPRRGTLTLTFTAQAPTLNVGDADWQTENEGRVTVGSMEQASYADITILAPPSPDLELTKEVALGRASQVAFAGVWTDNLVINDSANNIFTYRLTLQNNGSAAQDNIVWLDTTDFSASRIYDQLRLYQTVGGFPQLRNTYTSGDFILLENNLRLEPGQSKTYYLEATLTSPITQANLSHTNISRAQDADGNVLEDRNGLPVQDQAVVSLNLVPANITITKQVSLDGLNWVGTLTDVDPLVNNEVYYRIQVQNTGGVWTQGIDIVDSFTPNANNHVIYDRFTGDLNLPGSSQVMYLDQDIQLAPGQSITYNFTGELRNSFSQVNPIYTNLAQVRNHNSGTLLAIDDATVELDADAIIEVVKSVRKLGTTAWQTSLTAQPGDRLEYKIEVRNTGLVDQNNVVVSDFIDHLLPGGQTMHTTWPVSITNDTQGQNFIGDSQTASIVSVAAQTTESYQFTVQIRNPFPAVDGTIIQNNAIPSVGNPAAPTTVTVETTTDLRVLKLAALSPSEPFLRDLPIQPGNNVTYQLIVWNAGNGVVQNVNLRDILNPTEAVALGHYYTNLSLANPNINLDSDGNGVSWQPLSGIDPTANPYLDYQIPSIQGGGTQAIGQESLQFTLTLRSVNAGVFTDGQVLRNRLQVNDGTTTVESDATLRLNVPTPDLHIQKQVSRSATGPWNTQLNNVQAGSTLYYKISVWNTGDGAGTATITDALDSQHYTATSINDLTSFSCPAGGQINTTMLDCDADNNGQSFTGTNYSDLQIVVDPSRNTLGNAETFIFSAQLRSDETNPNALPEGSFTQNQATLDKTPPETSTTRVSVIYPDPNTNIRKQVRNVTTMTPFQSGSIQAQVGQEIAFRLVAQNTGAGPDRDYVFVDVIDSIDQYATINVPANASLEACPATVVGTNCLVWDPVTIQPGTTQEREFTVQIDNNLPALVNDVVVTNTYGNIVQVTIHEPRPVIAETKTARNVTQGLNDATQNQAQVGNQITYTLRVQNTGDADQANYQFCDEISDILEFANITDLGGATQVLEDCSGGAGVSLQWPVTDVASGDTETRSFTVTIKPSADWTNPAGDFFLTNVFGTTTINIPVGDVTQRKTATVVDGPTGTRNLVSGDQVRAGETVEYTLTVTNSGGPVTNYSFTDDITDLLFYTDLVTSGGAIQSGDCDANPVNCDLTWTINPLPTGDTTRTFRVRVKSPAQWPAPVAGNSNLDFTITNIFGQSTIDLLVFHTAVEVQKDRIDALGGNIITNGPISSGSDAYFRVTITNSGEVPIFAMKIRDIYTTQYLDFDDTQGLSAQLRNEIERNIDDNGPMERFINPGTFYNPAGLICWQDTPAPTDCSAPTDASELIPVGNLFTAGLTNQTNPQTGNPAPALAPGDSVSFETVFQGTNAGQAFNEAYVWVDDYLPYTIVGDGDDDTVAIGEATFAIDKGADKDSLQVGMNELERTVNYTVSLTNTGSVEDINQIVTDTLPQDSHYQAGSLAVTLDGNDITNTNIITSVDMVGGVEQITWEVTTGIKPTQVVIFNYDVIIPDQAGKHTNTAQVDTQTVQWTVETLTNSRVILDKSVDKDQVDETDTEADRTVTYTLDIINDGATTLTDIQVIDLLPTGFTYVPNSATYLAANTATPIALEPSFDATDNALIWVSGTLDTLAVGQKHTITYRAIAPQVAGRYLNTAEVTTKEAPKDTDQAKVIVGTTPPPLEIDKEAVGVTSHTTGGVATYEITLTNSSPDQLTGIRLVDILPRQGFSYITGSATLDGTLTTDPLESIQTSTNQPMLIWENISIPAASSIVISYRVDVPAIEGYHTNKAIATMQAIVVEDTATIYVDIQKNPVDPGPTPTIHVLVSAGASSTMLGIMIGVLLLLYMVFIIHHHRPRTWAVRPKTNN